ncbi:MAG: hydantoinase/oxoprolinase family protein, partial [Desulfofustis sp.]|nr:hydantoinase/oxoprolinase family protein [Desulfofustis sp.]
MHAQSDGKWKIWVDRGGTFTDIVARTPDGAVLTHKLLSENPEQYRDAALQGMRDLLGLKKDDPIPGTLIEHVKMGTTVATNALLERTGDRTLLVITRGFGDALRIGTQSRPHLFARHIILPEMLYEAAVEVQERVDANGTILTTLDEGAVYRVLLPAYRKGIRAVAIVCMHGYRYPDHEQRIAAVARDIGFSQVSTSHEVSPLMKLVPRGDTTVVDAYLSPILHRYVDQIAGDLGAQGERAARLMFMQSNGGLTDARMFQGKDAILSGPAGGVVGMVKTAEMSGYRKLIGFDMGGTSTDVAHFDGSYERSFETMVAGVRMRAPMMHIHTVAAGGGSILHFDGSRYRVGPDSAGANPGPASYRRGGPLTVTDCNVMLGKIQPCHFPPVFGPAADEPLDYQVVADRFRALAAVIADSTGTGLQSPEQVADGFLRIAVENMANAIKKISVQRGYDVTRYTLNCFGGAGGQHACLVADALGMTRIFLHPFAGVLSAYGMGLADITAMREVQVEKPLDETVVSVIEALSSPRENDACLELQAQGIEKSRITVVRKVHVRYEGTDSFLPLDFGTADEMRSAFEQAHRQRFGFVAREWGLVVEAVAIEAIGRADSVNDEVLDDRRTDKQPEPVDRVNVFMGGSWHVTPLFEREMLLPMQSVQGPAIILEKTGTVVLEPGWQAHLNERRHLLLERYLPRPQAEAVGTH